MMLNSVSMLRNLQRETKKIQCEKKLLRLTTPNEKHDDKLILKSLRINHKIFCFPSLSVI